MTASALLGQCVVLQPLVQRDLSHLVKWYSDPELLKLTGETEPWTREKAEQWFEKACSDEASRWFTIIVKDTEQVIGDAGLLRMFRPWHTTDMSVVIGEKDLWGHGYGTDAGRRLLQYAFDVLGFHRVAVGVVGFNTRAIRFWIGLGFQQEGIWRDGYYYNDQYSDFIMMSILEEEYRLKYGITS